MVFSQAGQVRSSEQLSLLPLRWADTQFVRCDKGSPLRVWGSGRAPSHLAPQQVNLRHVGSLSGAGAQSVRYPSKAKDAIQPRYADPGNKVFQPPAANSSATA